MTERDLYTRHDLYKAYDSKMNALLSEPAGTTLSFVIRHLEVNQFPP